MNVLGKTLGSSDDNSFEASEDDRGGESQEDGEGTEAEAEIKAVGRRGCFVESMLTSSMVTSGEEKTLGEASHTAESSICVKLHKT